MARAPLNPLSISFLIVLVMATIVFSLLFVLASNSITTTIEGSPEDATRRDPLDKVLNEASNLRQQEAKALEGIEIREREIDRLEWKLSQFRAYFVGADAIASTQGEDLKWDGRDYKAKESNWLMSRHAIGEIKNRLQSLRTEHESEDRQRFPGLEGQVDMRRSEQQAVLARSSEMDRRFKEDEEKLIALKDELEKKKLEVEKQRRTDYGVRASNINKKEDTIRTLLELELRWVKDLEADAGILQVVNPESVVIDIGAKDRAFPGLRLEVFQIEQGRYVEKGMVEVISVQERVSTARVLSQIDQRRRPLAVGDRLGNPVFSTKGTKVFVLAGEFKQFNATDIASFIRAAGGEVRTIITQGSPSQRMPGADVDFLVAGDRSDKTQDDARQYEIEAMTEAQILKYVQPAFSLK